MIFDVAMASWLVRSSPDRAIRVRALAVDIVLCSWARHLTLTVPLSTQVYLTIIPRARMGSESIAHEAEGRMGY